MKQFDEGTHFFLKSAAFKQLKVSVVTVQIPHSFGGTYFSENKRLRIPVETFHTKIQIKGFKQGRNGRPKLLVYTNMIHI